MAAINYNQLYKQAVDLGYTMGRKGSTKSILADYIDVRRISIDILGVINGGISCKITIGNVLGGNHDEFVATNVVNQLQSTFEYSNGVFMNNHFMNFDPLFKQFIMNTVATEIITVVPTVRYFNINRELGRVIGVKFSFKSEQVIAAGNVRFPEDVVSSLGPLIHSVSNMQNPTLITGTSKGEKSKFYNLVAIGINNLVDLLILIIRENSINYVPNKFVFEIRDKIIEGENRVGVAISSVMINENCLLANIREKYGDKLVDKLYKDIPELKGMEVVNQDMIARIATKGKISIDLYTDLGIFTNNPWMQFGTQKRKLKLRVNGGHAWKLTSSINIALYEDGEISIDALRKRPDWNKITKVNVGDADTGGYYCIDNIIYKKFRPSSVTGNIVDDVDIRYFHCHNEVSLLYSKFINDNLGLTSELSKLIRKCEMFSKRTLCTQDKESLMIKCVEVDHNRSYSSYETHPNYMGFPVGGFLKIRSKEIKLGEELKPAFIEVRRIVFKDNDMLRILRLYYGDKIMRVKIITYVMYLMLIEYADIEIEHVLYSKFEDLKLMSNDKFVRNKIIGKLIEGGMKSQKKLKFTNLYENEVNQIAYECDKLGYNYNCEAEEEYDSTYTCNVVMEVRNMNSHYHIHSYILSYSQTRVISTAYKYRDRLIGMNVDALILRDDNVWHESGWRIEQRANKVSELSNGNYYLIAGQRKLSDVTVDNGINDITGEYNESILPIGRLILILGSGGIGKTHMLMQKTEDAQLDDCLLTYTKVKRDEELAKYNKDIMTTQMYHHTSRDFGLRTRYNCIIEDEALMRNEVQWLKILKDNPDSIIIATGDECQIINTGLEFFAKHGFKFVRKERIEGVRCRHEFEYGVFLDSLRYCDYNNMRSKIESYGYFTTKNIDEYFNTNNVFVTSSWKRIKIINDLYRLKAEKIMVRDNNNEYSIVDVKDADIHWDKLSMDEKLPVGKKYIPSFARTVDSLQGTDWKEHKLIIDIEKLVRHGCLYTAITRACNYLDIVLYYS